MAKVASERIAGLVELKDRPKEIYYCGIWNELIWGKCVAVIGSRRMTNYGRQVIEKLVPQLVEAGYCVVSGFMYGVDQTAHKVAVECGGKTIAVLGWGIDWQMEQEDLNLAEEIIAKGGILISEWENQPPTRWTFPLRDRIIAAVSQEIFVVEAAERSGALITVNRGLELGRKIWAVPGQVTSNVSAGTNMLIKKGKAEMWLPEYSDVKSTTNKTDLYLILQNDAVGVDDLVRQTGRSAEDVGVELSMLLLGGKVEEKDGKFYLLRNT